MTFFDHCAIGLYFSIVFAIGVWINRSMKGGDDLFLAGRSLGWKAIGFSLFASNISSSTMIGLAGAAYTTGIAIANYEWMAALVLVFMSFFCIPVFLKTRITTLPELLENRFDRKARLYYSGITIFLSILVDTAGGLYAGALALQIFFPGIAIWQYCVGLALFAGFYTAIGGLKAVVYTDFIQAITLLVGSIVLTYLVFEQIGFSWESVQASVKPEHLSLFLPIDDPNMPWLGTLWGLPVLGFWYWSTNQYITQRILGAKDITNARWGALLGAFLKLIPLFTMVLPGVFAIQLFPNLENPDMVYPTLIKEILPVGLSGLVVAGLIAAIMSSVDSTLNSASTLVLHDFIFPRYKKIGAKQSLRMGQMATFTFMLIAAGWAPFIGNLGGLYFYLQQAFAILVPPVVVIYVMGIFTQRGSGPLAFQTLIFGHLLGLAFFVANQLQWLSVHFTIGAGITTTICFGFYLVFGKKNTAASSMEITWSDVQPKAGLARWQDYRVWATVILLLLATILILLF